MLGKAIKYVKQPLFLNVYYSKDLHKLFTLHLSARFKWQTFHKLLSCLFLQRLKI